MRVFLCLMVCAWMGCSGRSGESGEDAAARSAALESERANGEPVRVQEPQLPARELEARQQVALDIEAQPSEVQRRYYQAKIQQMERAIALEDKRLANLNGQGAASGNQRARAARATAAERAQARSNAQGHRRSLVARRDAAEQALERLQGATGSEVSATRQGRPSREVP